MFIFIGIVGGLTVLAVLIVAAAWLSCREMDTDAQTRKEIERWREGK